MVATQRTLLSCFILYFFLFISDVIRLSLKYSINFSLSRNSEYGSHESLVASWPLHFTKKNHCFTSSFITSIIYDATHEEFTSFFQNNLPWICFGLIM
jgi:hypothetical protein